MIAFAHNNFDVNAFMVVVLAGRDVFFDGGAIVMDVFSYAVMDEACCATNVMLITAVARELVHYISS